MLRAIIGGSLAALAGVLWFYAAALLMLLADDIGQRLGAERGIVGIAAMVVIIGGLYGAIFHRAFKGSETDPD
jgi:hypothetical protein